MKNLLSIFFVVSMGFAWAQEGTIRGAIKETATAEGLPFATVQVKGTTTGTVTDFEGNYSLALPEGSYDLEFSFIGYVTIEVTGVTVSVGEVTQLSVSLDEETEMLDAVVVSADQINNTEAAMLNIQRKSAIVMDGVSSQNFKKVGDSNVASAVRRVPGVSIDDGKYVFVRGLGDRYTKSTLNGVDVPGLDPDRNTVQMDVFPTNIVENVQVMKSSMANLPADFTGGVVNIVTKDFPEERGWTLSGGLGYNPTMHFNENYYSYQGGSTDWLGVDDGTRDLPIDRNTDIPSPAQRDPRLTEITKTFNPTLQAMKSRSFMDYNLGVSGGNQINFSRLSIGYTASLGYRNTTSFYQNTMNNSYLLDEDQRVSDLRMNRTQYGDFGTNNVLASALIGGSVSTKRSKVNATLMHLQNGESRAGYFNQSTFVENSVDLVKDNLEYTERSVTNIMLAGKHANDDATLEVEWKFAPTRSKIEDKDIRLTPYRIEGEGSYSIEPSESGDPTRIWRNLDEVNYVGRFDLTKKVPLFGVESSMKAGAYVTHKNRDYEILNYRINVRGNVSYTGQANELLSEEFIWAAADRIGSSVQGFFEPSNSYQSTAQTLATYLSGEIRLANGLRSIWGVRAEKYDQWYAGVDQEAVRFEDEKIQDMLHFFPSANLIYGLTETSNIRLSYSRTIARPSFREASYAQIFDPLTGRTFIGGLRPATAPDGTRFWEGDLKETLIDNLDLRWELFQSQAQMFAVSAFYKHFTDPIELVVFSDNAPDNFQPRNVGDAVVYGTELELRKNLGFISPTLELFSMSINTTLLKSIEEMDKSPNGEYESRLANARDGQTINDTRPLQGQSPYMINAGLSYDGANNGLQAGLFYNVQGRKLEVVGFGPVPDVYTSPFHSLNFNASKVIGAKGNQKIGLGVTNILGDDLESVFVAFRTTDQLFSSVRPDRRFSLRYSISF